MKIFIANFPYSFSEEDICELFKIFGEITDCKMVSDPETGQSKGYGFVEFREEAPAKMAINQMHNFRVAGRQVAVTLSTSESTAIHRKKKQRLKS